MNRITVERARNPRLIKHSGRRRHQKIADLAAARQCDVRRVKKWRGDRHRERLILLRAFENLLLPKIRIIWARRRMPIIDAVR